MISASVDFSFVKPEVLDGRQFHLSLVRGMTSAVALVQGAAKTNLSGRFVNVGRGLLRSSLAVAVEDNPPFITGRVGTNVPYGKMLEFGARPHEIRPRFSRVLSFMVGDRRVFATRVNHPGIRARSWLRTAFGEQFFRMRQAFLDEIARARFIPLG